MTVESLPITNKHLDAISDQLDKEKANPSQSLILLKCFANIIANENYRENILSIWMKLKSCKRHALLQNHYVLAMQLYQASGDIDGALTTLKEMKKKRISIPSYAKIRNLRSFLVNQINHFVNALFKQDSISNNTAALL